MSQVNLRQLVLQSEHWNGTDQWLIELARKTGKKEVLEPGDFYGGANPGEVEKFISAANTYLQRRLEWGADDPQAVSEFNVAISRLDLPVDYHPELPKGIQANPLWRTFLFKAHATAFVTRGEGRAWQNLQETGVTWSLPQWGLATKVYWPVDELTVFPYIVLGGVTTVGKTTGEMRGEGMRLAKVKGKDFSANWLAGIDYPVRTWLSLYFYGTLGYQFGSFDPTLTLEGRSHFENPCEVDTAGVLSDPNKATEAVTCEFKREVPAYDDFPWSVVLGARFLGRIEAAVSYRSVQPDVSGVVFAPDTIHHVTFWLGGNPF